MTNNFDYKNFYQLLQFENKKEQEVQLKQLIDTYLGNHFYVEDRTWFNLLINYGLINLVKHCEKTIANFSLYDKSRDCHHKSNLSFLKAIQSSNLELVDYFINHEDFPLFTQSQTIHESVANFVMFNSTERENFNIQNFEQLIHMLAEKFPLFVPILLNKIVLNQKNDEITPALSPLLKKYHSVIKSYFDNEAKKNTLTRLCMISLQNECYDLGYFLKKECNHIVLDSDIVSFSVCNARNVNMLDNMLAHPEFFVLQKENFADIFSCIFENAVSTTYTKTDYNFYFKVNKLGLHTVSHKEMQSAINKNLTPFVKKYYAQFKNENFDLSQENTCTRFIHKNKTEQMYKDYLKKYPVKNTVEKKMKI